MRRGRSEYVGDSAVIVQEADVIRYRQQAEINLMSLGWLIVTSSSWEMVSLEIILALLL